ncbi:hypothetical protein QE152_g7877 [Popillia japonica]|uniref:Nucleic-acid-binding protein from transposon X-element n=1 Tax=Popillia japonica TaxID=7064 RepID=A0AAW1MDS4_POPJA
MEDIECDSVIDSQPTVISSNDEDVQNDQQGANLKPPPICFVARVKSHYRELCAKLDAISREYFVQFAGEKTLVYFKNMRYSYKYFVQFAGEKTLVYFKNMRSYKQFIATYKNKIPFYTYTPKCEKTHAYVIKGLPEDAEPLEIKQELHAYVIKGLPEDAEPLEIKQELLELEVKVHNVVKFRNTRYPIYMCMTDKNVTINELKTKARYLQRARVYYETHINKKALTQCKKCQTWGHATLNCNLSIEQCVKCGQNHLGHQCNKDKNVPAKCANCGGDHPASSTECRIYINELGKLRASKQKARRLREPLQSSQNSRYIPAPPPPVNAWTAKKQFPPLPVKKSQPSMSQQKRSSKEEVRSRNQEPEAGNCSSEEDSTPSAAVRRREPSSSGRVATGLRSRSNGLRSRSKQGDKLYLHEIANTMEEINSIVNLKKLSANLKQLLIAIKKCSTPFEQVMTIHQFNLDNAN